MLATLTAAFAATLTIAAVLDGLMVQMERDLEQIGLDLVNVHVSPSLVSLFRPVLRVRDWHELERLSGGRGAAFAVATAVVRGGEQAEGQPTAVIATTAAWGQLVPLSFAAGRFFRDGERDVCVLDQWLAERLFLAEDAVGRTITLQSLEGQRSVRVVGVLGDPFQIRKRFSELDVVAPARSGVLKILEFRGLYVPGNFAGPNGPIHGVVLKAPPGTDAIELARRLRQRFGTRGGKLWIWARKAWGQHVTEAAELFLRLAHVIWGIVLAVAAAMIGSVTLVAVRQRYYEIFIRRAEGALRVHVFGQLMIELLWLAIAAAALSVPLALYAGSQLQAYYLAWAPAYTPGRMAAVFAFGLLALTAATCLPAWRATTLAPLELARKA